MLEGPPCISSLVASDRYSGDSRDAVLLLCIFRDLFLGDDDIIAYRADDKPSSGEAQNTPS
jgi:hypothetical protein